MRHVKLYEEHLTPEQKAPINEQQQEWATDPKIKSEADLKAQMLKAGPALQKFLKSKGLNWPGEFKIVEKNGRFELQAKELSGKECGVLGFGIEKVSLGFWSGFKLPAFQETEAGFEFSPNAWTSLHYAYSHPKGGSNGTEVVFPGHKYDALFYDVAAGDWKLVSF